MVIAAISLAVLMLAGLNTRAADPADFSHFEAKVRPLLVAHCLQCHAGAKTSGGLALDSREGWQKGGDSGPAIVPGELEASLLLGLLNAFVRPLLMVISLPLLIFSLGLFVMVINAVLLSLVGGMLQPGFVVDGFGSAFWGVVAGAAALLVQQWRAR
jgi:uncharacterized membrane protein YvlD (DUF360 family)